MTNRSKPSSKINDTFSVEGPVESRKRLDVLFHKSFDPQALTGIRLDKREVARFIAEKTRILNVAAVSGGLPSLSWLIENVFYEAYVKAQAGRNENVEFSCISEKLQ